MPSQPTVLVLTPTTDERSADVINFLEAALEEARSGEIVAVAIVKVRRGGAVASAWLNGSSRHELTSGAASLLWRLSADP